MKPPLVTLIEGQHYALIRLDDGELYLTLVRASTRTNSDPRNGFKPRRATEEEIALFAAQILANSPSQFL